MSAEVRFVDLSAAVFAPGCPGQALASAAAAFADTLPAQGPLLNLCSSRTAFATTLLAAGISRRPAVLSWSASATVIAEMLNAHPDAVVISDETTLSLPCKIWTPPRPASAGACRSLAFPASQRAVIAYTSGSTGTPTPYPKTWGALSGSAQRLAARVLEGLASAQILATVPPQHVFGLETSILIPLFSDACCLDERPLFPADIREALARMQAPRLLVTTPVHLRALLNSGVRLPPLARILSATAPLPLALAEQAEAQFGTEIIEIYGSTETGGMATRWPSRSALWQPVDGVHVAEDGATWQMHAPYHDEPCPLADHLVLHEGGAFELLGRQSDLIKVAGRRISAGDLTQRLLAIPGVEDAVIMPADTDDLTGRPAALVVAPGLSEREILDALAQRVDTVFLPRPLRRVAALPRNEMGKLPRQRLLELLGD